MRKLEFHPLLKQVPMMPLHERDALANDIEKNGQILPILTWQGKIIDGRNRYLACLSRAIEPKVTELAIHNGGSYVASLNYFRKHWTTTERAHFAALMSIESERGNPEAKEAVAPNAPNGALSSVTLGKKPTQAEAAKAMGVSKRSVQRAKAQITGRKPVKSDAPEDKLGTPIPPAALPWWERRQEILDMLHHISAVRSFLEKIPQDDKLYARIMLGNTKRALGDAFRDLQGVLPSYVCGYCEGVNDVYNCKGCNGTGLLSVYLDKALPPEKRANARR